MKNEELFEALSELDDELIANAKHIDTYGGQTIVLRRTPVWKIVTGSVAAAACTALLVVGGVHAMNYVNQKAPVSSNPGSSTSWHVSKDYAVASAEYPEEAKYVYKGDYGELSYVYCTEKAHNGVSLMPEFFGSYEEMAAASDLIVSGQFTDLSHQTYDPYDEEVTVVVDSPSYNTFYIDKVIKGDIKSGECVAIRQNSYVYLTNVYLDWDMSPMICGDKWIYFLVMGEDGYYTPVTPKQGRYPLPFSENKKLPAVSEYGYYGYDNPNYQSDPNIETIYADTLEAFGLGVSENFDGVELSVVLNDNTFGVDDDVRVKATVRNTTDKPIGLLMPCTGEGSHREIFTAIVHGGYPLTDIDTEGKGFDDAIDSHIVQPGEEYVQEMTFRLKDKAEQGKYYGTAIINLLSDPNDETSETTEHSVKFTLTVGNENAENTKTNDSESVMDVTKVYEYGNGETKEWTMPEFPGVSFRCDGEGVSVLLDGENGADEYGYFLYTGMPILDVYLADLNGDGCREIVSTASYGSGIIVMSACAFDFANGVRYMLFDHDIFANTLAEDKGVLTVRKFKYYGSDNEPISEQPLTLDMMTSDGSCYVFKGFEPAEWTMDEFPGIRFRADKTGIFARREDGSESNIAVDSEYDQITCVYLYDNDGDGKREIIFEYIDKKGMHISRMMSADVLLAEFSTDNTGYPIEPDEIITHLNIPAVIRGSEYVLRDHSDYTNENLNYRGACDYCNVDENAAVVSFCEGEVVSVDAEPNYNGGRGRYVAVRDDLGYYYFYSHLSAVSVNVGDKVIAGTQIGIVGNSGRWDVEENGFGVCLATYDHMPDISVSEEFLPE